jgi:NRPS condensation-like uncharacterized protein
MERINIKISGKNRGKKVDKKPIKWDKLDNTAHVFPVIAGETMSNVYRISVVLTEEINEEMLQKALDDVLPKFSGFNVRLRRGVFWYYFEENNKPSPRVKEESEYPCQFILQHKNNSYLFRVTYYKCRINLEVFHVLTDGMGGINFLRELTYRYLSLIHPEIDTKEGFYLGKDTSLNREDSFLKNYRIAKKKTYKSSRAYLIKGNRLLPGEFGVIHGYMSIAEIKVACKSYGVSINEYLVGTFIWSVFKESMHGIPGKRPIRVTVPVNLRPYFDSMTTKNFFAMVAAEFDPENREYTFQEVLTIVAESLRKQINKDHLEEIFSYNVSNEKNIVARAVPLFIKNIAIRYIYNMSALANTATVTNIGNVTVEKNFEPYIEMFHAYLAMSKGQLLKGTIASYQDQLSFNFSSILVDTNIEKRFFRQLVSDGIEVIVESNGVYDE